MTRDDQDALQYLATTHRALHAGRSDRSFRVVITTLTFDVLAAAARLTGSISVPANGEFRVAVWIIFLVLAFIVCLELWQSAEANNWNQTLAQNAENKIIGELQTKNPITKPESRNPRRVAWAWQGFIVALGAVAAAYIVTSSK